MMDIVMLIAGAGVGAMLRDLFVLHRGDKSEARQQLESKTPYDYALTNAINERDRLQDELRTIQALKRTEADTERIRNEIVTILSDDGEEASGGTSGLNLRCGEEIMNSGGEYFQVVNKRNGTIRFVHSDKLAEEDARGSGSTSIKEHGDGTNVREDVSKDGRLTEDDVERSYNHNVRQAFRDRTSVRVLCTGGMVAGEITTIAFEYGELTELQLNGIDVSIPEIIEIRKGDHMNGETLYRKGNR